MGQGVYCGLEVEVRWLGRRFRFPGYFSAVFLRSNILAYSIDRTPSQKSIVDGILALMENASMLAVSNELSDGQTTVGGYIESSHLSPSQIGDIVSATAEVIKVGGKKIEFKVSAYSGETLLGEGKHLRFIVDKERFMR